MRRSLLVIVLAVLCLGILAYHLLPGPIYKLSRAMERRSAGLTEKHLLVGDHHISYLEGGQGPNVLLVHGFSANKDHWTRFARYLTPAYRVVAVDLPGFGESSRIESESYTIVEQAERLDRIAEALGLASFHIAGNSMGGNISGHYAHRFPEKVLSLGLFNSAGIETCPERSELSVLLERGENPLLVSSPEDFDRVMAFVFVSPPWIPAPAKRYLANMAALHRSFDAKIFEEIRRPDQSLEPLLSEIRVPTLILWGDRDRLIHVSCARVLEQGIPDARTVIMEACGHAPMIERPEEAAGHYRSFLAGLR